MKRLYYIQNVPVVLFIAPPAIGHKQHDSHCAFHAPIYQTVKQQITKQNKYAVPIHIHVIIDILSVIHLHCSQIHSSSGILQTISCKLQST